MKVLMTVYLDLLFIDNFTADCALLYLAVKTAKGEVKFWRIALCALFATLLAIGYTLLRLYRTVPPWADGVAKFGVAALLPLLAAKYKKKSTAALAALSFLAYAFALAGALTALFADWETEEGSALVYTVHGIPSGVLVAGAVLFVFAAKRAVLKLSKRKKILSLVVDCELCHRGAKIPVRGFLDSGNLLTAPDGSFVAVAERGVALKLLGENLFGGQTELIQIPVETVNGKSVMTAFKIEKLVIYYAAQPNIIEDVTLGISPDGVRGEYDLILPLTFVQG